MSHCCLGRVVCSLIFAKGMVIKMKKIFKMKDLGCANCSAKMERAIKNLDGVNDASVNFMTQRLMLDALDDRFDDILEQATAICKKIEPDCSVLV